MWGDRGGIEHGGCDGLDAMDEREGAALRFAEAMNESGLKVTDEIFHKLQSHFSPGEIIELLATVGLMVFASRLADALGLEAES
jgi:alkylhydroperoxidase family enzyme